MHFFQCPSSVYSGYLFIYWGYDFKYPVKNIEVVPNVIINDTASKMLNINTYQKPEEEC